MDDIAELEAATLPTGLVTTATADVAALAAKVRQITEGIIEFEWAVNRALKDHPARGEVVAPADEARQWSLEISSYLNGMDEDFRRIAELIQGADQRREAIVASLRGY